MRVTYTPEGGDAQEWAFNPKRVRQSEAEMVEKRAGCRWDEFVVRAKAEQAAALKVLLWHLMRRQHPALRLEDVPDFYMGEMSVGLDLDELLEARELAMKNPHLFTPEEFAAGLAEIDAEIAEARARGEVETGKATSSSVAASTASPSPTTSASAFASSAA